MPRAANTRKKRKMRGGYVPQYTLKNTVTTLADQCRRINPDKLPRISQEEDFHRSIVFFKALRDKVPINLAMKALPQEEEDRFIEEWRQGLAQVEPNERDPTKKRRAEIQWTMRSFLNLPESVTDADLDMAHIDFGHGIEAAIQYKNKPANNALLAFNCRQRANIRQGPIARFLTDIVTPKRVREYSFDEEKFTGVFVSLGTDFNTPTKLVDATISVLNQPTELLVGPTDTAPYQDTLYILTDRRIQYTSSRAYTITAKRLPEVRLIGDLIRGGHILDIHPRLAYLMYMDPSTRPLVDEIYGGSLIPRQPYQLLSNELVAFYFALCWEYFHDEKTPKSYGGTIPFNWLSYPVKYQMISTFYVPSATATNNDYMIDTARISPIGDDVVERIMTTVDWATGRRRQRPTFTQLYAALPRPTDSDRAQVQINRFGLDSLASSNPQIGQLLAGKSRGRRSIYANNESRFTWNGGAMPEFFKYYAPEVVDIRKTCPEKSVRALEKIPRLSLEGMFRRAVLFWKYIRDKLPVPLTVVALPPAEERAFIAEWQRAVAGSEDAEAASLAFLGANDATVAEYERTFNAETLLLLAHGCKARPDASMLFNRLIGYILKTDRQRQYAFEANVLGAECGALADGAAQLTAISFITRPDAQVQVECDPKKGVTAVVADRALFVLTDDSIGYQTGSKAYTLQGPAILKAALPRDVFQGKKVLDLHPKVAYFLWKDPVLRRELLLPCFGEGFLPAFSDLVGKKTYKSLASYEDEFARIYYQLCYDVAHAAVRINLGDADMLGGNGAAGTGILGLSPVASPVASSYPSRANRIKSMLAATPHPADFYRLPNDIKYARIIGFLNANPAYKIPAPTMLQPKQGFFSRLFTRKRRPLLNEWRTIQPNRGLSQENIQSNSVMLASLFGAFEGQQPTRIRLEGGLRRKSTRRRHRSYK